MDIPGFDPVPPFRLLPLREQAALRNSWLERRLATVLPALMDRAGIDLWVLVAREYDEDPVLRTMLPAEWLSARRRTLLLLHRTPQGVDAIAVSRYPVGRSFRSVWTPETEPDQWARFAECVSACDPSRIGIDTSPRFAHADGISATERDRLLAALPDPYRGRVVSAEVLAVGWLETRIPEEMEIYPGLVRLGREIIHAGFGPEALSPGTTTTEDLVWWYRERIQSLGLVAWFQPTVEVQRPAPRVSAEIGTRTDGGEVILPGDLVHVDLGVVYAGLHTDTQQHAYVLRDGETSAPPGLEAAMRRCNRVQDLLVAELRPGRSGNDVLAAARAACAKEGLDATLYSHPLGVHGHAAGATIGLWDQQGGVAGSGDYPVHPQTVWSIELNVRADVPEWAGQSVRIMLEEDAHLGADGVVFLDGRQESLALV
ncbi:MAG: M24 family metallopeptidase [Candidatus Eisenbacteria bacterium]